MTEITEYVCAVGISHLEVKNVDVGRRRKDCLSTQGEMGYWGKRAGVGFGKDHRMFISVNKWES